MSDKRNIFTSKDFVINSNIIKCISNLDITLDEFLLVLYFINVSLYLNTDDIKDKLGFDEKKVVSIFTSLLNKRFIELDVSNNNGTVTEKIKLDPLYDRLILNNNIEKDNNDIYALFERELGRTLSSFEYEMMNKWIESGTSEETIKKALKEAVLNDARSFKYIDKIIYDWSKNGVKTKIKEENNSKEVFDYNWLDEDEA